MTNLYERFLEFEAEEATIDRSSIDSRVLLVDGLNMYIRCFAATPTMNDDGDHVGGMAGFVKSLGLTIRQLRPTRCIIVFDGKGGSARRRKVFPDYKQNRKTMTRLNRTYNFKDKEEEAKSLSFQLIELAKFLKCLPVTVLAPSYVEADDVIAYLAHTIEERGGQSIIVSTDKDFYQIVNDNITIWNPIKKQIYDSDTILDEYGIHPINFAVYRALSGDKSDNIPGIPRAGTKTVLKNFPELADTSSLTIDDVLQHAAKGKKNKLLENITEHTDMLHRNYQLMQLEESAISSQNKNDILSTIDQHHFELNKVELTQNILALGMGSVFRNYDQWLQTTFAPLMRYKMVE